MGKKDKVTVSYSEHMRGWPERLSEREYDTLAEAEAEVVRVRELNEYWINAKIKK